MSKSELIEINMKLANRYKIGKVIMTVLLIISAITEALMVGLNIFAFFIDPGADVGTEIYIAIAALAIAICLFAFFRHILGNRIKAIENK